MFVKANQPTLQATLELLLGSPVATRVITQRGVTRGKGHGRIEVRELVSSEILAGHHPFPGLMQIFELTRQRRNTQTGKRQVEVVHGITSLSSQEAKPRRLMALARGHWKIENRSHYVRDVTYREDQSQVRNGTIAQVLAAVRNTAIGLMRVAGKQNIAAATRYYAAKPWEALALLGAPSDF
jgi:predicted transposase YbfD/YdcC